jgi:hypothetical protein
MKVYKDKKIKHINGLKNMKIYKINTKNKPYCTNNKYKD